MKKRLALEIGMRNKIGIEIYIGLFIYICIPPQKNMYYIYIFFIIIILFYSTLVTISSLIAYGCARCAFFLIVISKFRNNKEMDDDEPTNQEVELFRVILGPRNSLQTPIVVDKIKEMQIERKFGNRNINFEYFTMQEVITLRLTESQFLLWCSEAKYLLFCGHPLQNDFGPLWDHIKFANDLREVAGRKGNKVFPPAEAMHAAFTQDKREIYEAMQEFMLPTFMVERPTGPNERVTTFDEETLAELYE